MQITFEISKAHVCQDNVCFKTSFVLVKNMTNKVILGLPFITLLYPFTVDQDGLITYPMDEKVKFKFLAKPERSQLNAFKSNSISKSVNLIKSKTQQIEFLKEEQLSQKTLQQRIQLLKDRIKSEVCSDVPTAFWHRKKHTVSLPYIKDFERGAPKLVINYKPLNKVLE
jgi:hypothetical protein